ncbi:hypothetical protein HPP92_008597 [Vanilla planifolia]|uniref:COP1-interacting protein 7 n=1 Tax=Vanilla planifolia TaxID=51239 RepID=A0A835RDM2_VANPL|nr:hypothetical protein HPP92_008597 [Vanilla planifolia]
MTVSRCDLVIVANGKTEKIASGLLNPFLSHLKTARDQIGKGGYSIKLVPDPAAEAAWFTKDTVERFVRFVSTPEVLERVNTIESEILQIEDAISIQGNGNLGISTVEEHHHAKPIGSSEGSKPVLDPDADKAIVLYKPGSHANTPEPNGSKTNEESSKVQLVRVLESRKKVLQKEQAMAFARAAAAGFDVDNMGDLISFAESFGALRLNSNSLGFNYPDKSLPSEHQATNGQSEYYHGQFQHPSIPQWPIHPQLGPHMFQPYPLQAMPYYQNYPVNGQLFQAPPPTMHDPRSMHQRKGKKKHSRSKVSTSTSGDSSQGTSESESDEEPLRGHGSHQKVGRSGKKKGVVVIRNLNYIAGRGPETTGNGSESAPDPELEEGKDSLSENEERKHKPSSSSKKKDNHSRNMDIASVDRNEVQLPLQEADAGNWQAFQSFLLRAEEKMVNSKLVTFLMVRKNLH